MDWKKFNITTIHKKGYKHSRPSNYRPISLTSIVVKTFERMLHHKLSIYLSENNLLSPVQHGFRSKHSCQTQLLHRWLTTLNNNARAHVIFLDFSKAFDTVPHQRLLIKFENLGIRGQLLNWIKAYLVGRSQRVVIEGMSSEWTTVTSGVPQGSIFGSLLFLAYINDIGIRVSSCTKLFADDCALYHEVCNIKDAESLQHDLTILSKWSHQWQLHFNVTKCKAMQISNKNSTVNFTYRINNTALEWVTSFKYLGVIIDTKLNWREHVNYAAMKATKILNILRRNLYHSSNAAKNKSYIALVRPHIDYAAPVWSPHKVCDVSRLEKVQKRAARWIAAKWNRNEH